MDFRITKCNNYIKLKGKLNKNAIGVFNNEFAKIFENYSNIKINIEGLDAIDKYGVRALVNLHNQSLKNNVQFSIIGSGFKELYNFFKSSEAA